MATKVNWRCEVCEIDLGPEGMLRHLEEVHNITGKVNTKKRQVVFADAPGYSMQQWEWIIKEIKLTQTIEVSGFMTPFTDLDVIP